MHQPQGYIALIALLVVAIAGLSIALGVSSVGLDQLQHGFGQTQAARARSAATACVEEGLERLRLSWAQYQATLPVGTESCILEVVVNGSTATVRATSTVGSFSQRAGAEVGTDLQVQRWLEE